MLIYFKKKLNHVSIGKIRSKRVLLYSKTLQFLKLNYSKNFPYWKNCIVFFGKIFNGLVSRVWNGL